MTADHTERISAAPQPSLETRQGIEALQYLSALIRQAVKDIIRQEGGN